MASCASIRQEQETNALDVNIPVIYSDLHYARPFGTCIQETGEAKTAALAPFRGVLVVRLIQTMGTTEGPK